LNFTHKASCTQIFKSINQTDKPVLSFYVEVKQMAKNCLWYKKVNAYIKHRL